jgi:hypothetical protein
MNRTFLLALPLAAVLALPAAAKVVDVGATGPGVAPVIRASEDTAINYGGGEPPLFTAALDADDSVHNRPTTCSTLSAVGTAAAFDTITITNNSGVVANFIVTSSLVGGGACGDPNDTFFTLYNTTFNPASALTNCLAVNDDIAAAANRCSTLTFAIPVGQVRILVVSGFNNANDGGLFSYQINFTGTTPVDLIEFQVD